MFYYCFIIGRLTVYMVHSATEGGEEREGEGGVRQEGGVRGGANEDTNEGKE